MQSNPGGSATSQGSPAFATTPHPTDRTRAGRRGRSLRIGVLDLVTNRPDRTLWGRLMNGNLVAIMPQVVAAWAERLGHRVTYVAYAGFEDVRDELPSDMDVLFVCAFTQSAYLAYSFSNIYRRRGVVTVLGGPHARSYADDAGRYFDYVLGFTDMELLRDLLAGLAPQRQGVQLAAASQPDYLPGIRERWPFIRKAWQKTRFLHVAPVIGSLGCPYTCSFCVDATVRYRPLAYDQLREDLVFLRKNVKRAIVGWHDPNFGVRFDDYMDVIETAVPPGSIRFIAESTLSLLSEPNLKRLRRNGFVAMLPGIESWHEQNPKTRTGSLRGMDKVRAVSEHINLVAHYIPYIQTNFVLGLDADAGEAPFELTKRFLDRTPNAFPGYSLFTAFGDSSPLFEELEQHGRVMDFPFPLLDNNSSLNVRLKNYSLPRFYDHLIDLVGYSFSPRRILQRFASNMRGVPRWLNLVRAVSSEGRGRYRYHQNLRRLLECDREVRAYLSGDSETLPAFFRHKIRCGLGPFFDSLPEDLRDYLKQGRRRKDALVA